MKYVKLFFSYRARQFEKHGFEKIAFKVFSSKNRRSNMTWQKNSWLPQFFELRPEILHAYFWMHMQSNNDEKKFRFFDPFTGKAPLKDTCTYLYVSPSASYQSWSWKIIFKEDDFENSPSLSLVSPRIGQWCDEWSWGFHRIRRYLE